MKPATLKEMARTHPCALPGPHYANRQLVRKPDRAGTPMGRKRLRFHVDLCELEVPEVSLKELAKGKGIFLVSNDAKMGGDDMSPPGKKAREQWEGSKAASIITQIERKYCGQFKITDDDEIEGNGEGEGEDDKAKRKKRKVALPDDEYDLDDPFIDDSELMMAFEKQEEAETTITKYAGFFVNTGDLEVSGHLVREDSDKDKKKRKKKKKDDGATKAASTVGDANDDVVDENYWPPSAEGEASLRKLRDQAVKWRVHNRVDEVTLAELPAEFEGHLFEVELAIRRGTRLGLILPQYVEALQGCVAATQAVWEAALKKVVAAKVLELDEHIKEAVLSFKQWYDKKRQTIIANQQKSAEAGKETSTSVKGVIMDAKLKDCLVSLTADLRQMVLLKNLHPSQYGGKSSFDEEEEKMLTELSEIWPKGGMTSARLRKAYIQKIAKDKEKAEGKQKAAAEGGARSSTSSPALSVSTATATAAKGGLPVPAALKKRSSSSSSAAGGGRKKSQGGGGAENKKAKSPKTNGTSNGAGEAKNGGKGKASQKAGSATKQNGSKAKSAPPPRRPSGPVMGVIVAKKKYNPADFIANK